MDLMEVLKQVRELLQKKGRITYRLLQAQFHLDNQALEALREELIEAEQVAVDENGKVLVWVGKGRNGEKDKRISGENEGETAKRGNGERGKNSELRTLNSELPSAERRQLTVMFCDLVGSTALSEQLDPEEYHTLVRTYQETCTTVIRRYDGHIAQHLGDGLLVYFGYPLAHEDDAQRAVRTGLEIIEKVHMLSASSPASTGEGRGEGRLQVRIGIHTGLVVIGEIGSSEKREILALGETPNIAARLQSLAEPDTVALSAVTQRLIVGLFECQDLGLHTLKGISTPLSVYRVIRESEAQSRFEVAISKGLTPLVGREEELGLLRRRWEQAKASEGQVVLLSGEPGIGKSRLVQTLKEQVMAEGATHIEFRCSAYHSNSAFYPIVEHLQRLLRFGREDSPQAKLTKLQQTLAAYRFPQADTLPLLATLLSLPQPEDLLPLTLSPQKQKQKTQETLVIWLVEEAERTAIYCVWEDLHWADPSTLELLMLYLEQIPTARIFTVLTCRPEFTPPWSPHSYLTQLMLSRLGRSHVEAMVEKVAGEKALPSELLQQIVAKTDGVPLFVEELTKSVVETVGAHDRAPLQSLAIPTTLHDTLMARLDRLAPVREIAQLGATLGREFSYELLHALSPLDEAMLQQGLRQLVEAELLYQRGVPPQATYLFKHALIQDTAYQSLLKSKRQQYHQQIAQVLDEHFPETKEAQPELLAHHYTEAGFVEQAIPNWQQAGQKATQRSANAEAIIHLTTALDLLKTLPDTPERRRQELALQIALGVPLTTAKGYGALEVEQVYARARVLCEQLRDAPQLFSALNGLRRFYFARAELQTVYELAEQLLRLAQNIQEPPFLVLAHQALGAALWSLAELVSAQENLERGSIIYNPQQHQFYILFYGEDPGVICLAFVAWVLWLLGYPDRALERSQEAVSLSQTLSHPLSLTLALNLSAEVHLCRGEQLAAQERAEAAIMFSTEYGIPFYLVNASIQRGVALTAQGQEEEGITQIRQGVASLRSTVTMLWQSYRLAQLAEVYGKTGQVEEGLAVLAEAVAIVDKTGERWCEAELYRLKGELTLQKLSVVSSQLSDPNTQPLAPSTQAEAEAEACFLKAIEISRQQQAKSLELRAVMSLVRLRQQQVSEQGVRSLEQESRTTHHETRVKLDEAYKMLSDLYHWFTEGFDTKDLQEAKALTEELSH